jgi:hypothetical protein
MHAHEPVRASKNWEGAHGDDDGERVSVHVADAEVVDVPDVVDVVLGVLLLLEVTEDVIDVVAVLLPVEEPVAVRDTLRERDTLGEGESVAVSEDDLVSEAADDSDTDGDVVAVSAAGVPCNKRRRL